jgi:hypothetical protein
VIIAGSTYVFRRAEGEWHEEAKLTAPRQGDSRRPVLSVSSVSETRRRPVIDLIGCCGQIRDANEAGRGVQAPEATAPHRPSTSSSALTCRSNSSGRLVRNCSRF